MRPPAYTDQQHKQALQLEAIARAQSQFIREQDRSKVFDGLLADILALTDSEYGFISEVLYTAEGVPYLKSYAITNIAWNDETRAFYDAYAAQGLEFFNLDSLFGAALTSGEPVIANDPANDPRSAGLPEGHPPLNCFLGVPVRHGGELVAMLGLANRAAGYDEELLDFLRPLLATLGQLVDAARVRQQHHDNELELARLSQVASQTTNGVVITDKHGLTEWINDGFTRISGYTLPELLGRTPGEILQGQDTDAQAVARMSEAVANGKSFEEDIINYSKDGEAYWIRISCNPLRNAEGELQGFIAIESDITREKNDAELIRESERRLAAVIEGTHIGTWEWNVQTGETVFNARWADIIGYTLAELEPVTIQTWNDLAHPDDYQESGKLLQKHFAGELDYYDCQCRMRHKDGHWVWVHDRGRVVSWTQDGKPLLMSGTHADITERKQAEMALRDSEARLNFLLTASPVVIYTCAVTSPYGATFISPNIERIMRYTPEQFTDDSTFWAEHIHPDDRQRVMDNLPQLFVHGSHEHEYRFRLPDGSYRWMLDELRLLHNDSGEPVEIIGSWTDISERKRIDQMKNDFISTVSHELRTPLTAIRGALGLIESGMTGKLSEKLKKMITIANKNSWRLGLLIDDLLDMEKLVAGKMRFDIRRHDLLPLVTEAIRDNQAYAERYQVRFVLDTQIQDAPVAVDAQRLQQVLANLLSNAAKFSPEGGNVDVIVYRLDNRRVRVDVVDQGPGIPAAFHDQIFEKFAQADSSNTRRQSGTGLGLAISRQIIERMSGRIGFESEEGKGARFFFILPLARDD